MRTKTNPILMLCSPFPPHPPLQILTFWLKDMFPSAPHFFNPVLPVLIMNSLLLITVVGLEGVQFGR